MSEEHMERAEDLGPAPPLSRHEARIELEYGDIVYPPTRWRWLRRLVIPLTAVASAYTYLRTGSIDATIPTIVNTAVILWLWASYETTRHKLDFLEDKLLNTPVEASSI